MEKHFKYLVTQAAYWITLNPVLTLKMAQYIVEFRIILRILVGNSNKEKGEISLESKAEVGKQ